MPTESLTTRHEKATITGEESGKSQSERAKKETDGSEHDLAKTLMKVVFGISASNHYSNGHPPALIAMRLSNFHLDSAGELGLPVE